MTQENVLITICARVGSKGLTNKNWLVMNGKPLLQWTIEQAINWGGARDIVVTTNSIRAERIAMNFPECRIIERHGDLAKDDTPKIEVIRDAFLQMNGKYFDYDAVIDLDITNPLRRKSDIANCWKLYKEKKPDTVITGCHARKNPHFNQVYFTERVKKVLPTDVFTRQAAPKIYDMNASIYVYNADWLSNNNNNFPITNNTLLYLMQDWQAFDIDNETDFFIVEKLMQRHVKELEIEL